MEISFSNENASNNESEVPSYGKVDQQATPGKVKMNNEKESQKKEKSGGKVMEYNVASNGMTKKNSLNEVIYENPYNDSQYDDISTPND